MYCHFLHKLDQKFGTVGADGNISQMSIKMISYLKEKNNTLKIYVNRKNKFEKDKR